MSDPDLYEILLKLEKQDSYAEAKKYLTTFEAAPQSTRYKNSYLMSAIVLGYMNAAIYILTQSGRTGLDYKDGFSGSYSTALILCAKTGLNKVAMLLIGLGADVNQTDYRSFSALHYACLYRNDALILALLASGAKTNIKNFFGKYPIDYYQMDITEQQLAYPYGHTDDFALKKQYDHGQEDFSGTACKDLSALRWFIHNIIVNFQWGVFDTIAFDVNQEFNIFWDQKKLLTSDDVNKSIYEFSVMQLDHKNNPVTDIRLFNAMMKCFVENRKKIEVKNNIANYLKHSSDDILLALCCLFLVATIVFLTLSLPPLGMAGAHYFLEACLVCAAIDVTIAGNIIYDQKTYSPWYDAKKANTHSSPSVIDRSEIKHAICSIV